MSDSNQRLFDEFLAETEPLIDNLDNLPWETVSELYNMYGESAKSVTSIINRIDPELRVIICDRQDKLLERIIDTLPDDSIDAIESKPNGVFSPALGSTVETVFPLWKNPHLTKDCGLSVYLLAKEFGARPVMLFGTDPENYPSLSVLPGMEMVYINSESVEKSKKDFTSVNSSLSDEVLFGYSVYYECLKHLDDNYKQMDILTLFGIYRKTSEYMDHYRRLRPDGKTYCALDMNSYWMQDIDWSSPEIVKLGTQCDILATSCRYIRDELNRNHNVNFPCRWLPNGFYNPTDYKPVINSDIKENIILTVGRIGTAQKNNAELMAAFARVSEFIGNWKLKLVGSIEPEFESFISEYFTKFPKLRERIVFTGEISDKIKLYEEYAKAKIFALTSTSEGFPNVFAEALYHGCKFITSDIDAADDITNYGELGIKYKLGDIEALAGVLACMCCGCDKAELDKHMPKTKAYFDKYFNWARNIKKLRYMLYGH